MQRTRRVAVLGAGVSGLSVGNVLLQEKNLEVTIVAEKFSPNTCSDKAAAILWPNDFGRETAVDSESEAYLQEQKYWFEVTYKYFCELIHTDGETKTGANLISGYFATIPREDAGHDKSPATHDGDEDKLWYKHILNDVRRASEWERRHYRLPGNTPAYFTTLIAVDCLIYLPWLMVKFLQNGGKVVSRRVRSLAELQQEYDVVVNCAGLESRTLVDDSRLLPVFGQCVSVQAPWIKHFVIVYEPATSEYTLVLPRVRDVVMGGVVQSNRDSTSVDPAVRTGIMARAKRLVPSLADAKVLSEWTGIRPGRDRIRLELEQTALGPIVHNYGHGGNGVNYSWGCASSVCELVRNAFSSLPPSGKNQQRSNL